MKEEKRRMEGEEGRGVEEGIRRKVKEKLSYKSQI